MPSFRLLLALTRFSATPCRNKPFQICLLGKHGGLVRATAEVLQLLVVSVCVLYMCRALYPLSPLPLFNGHIKKGLIVVVVVTVTDAGAVVVVAVVVAVYPGHTLATYFLLHCLARVYGEAARTTPQMWLLLGFSAAFWLSLYAET